METPERTRTCQSHPLDSTRWDVVILRDDDLAMYQAAKLRVLSPGCAAWLENGGPVSPSA